MVWNSFNYSIGTRQKTDKDCFAEALASCCISSQSRDFDQKRFSTKKTE